MPPPPKSSLVYVTSSAWNASITFKKTVANTDSRYYYYYYSPFYQWESWGTQILLAQHWADLTTQLSWLQNLSSSFFFFLNLFIYFWLCWVFVSVRGLSLVAESGGHSSSRCAGLSLSRPLLRSKGSRRTGSVVVAHGPSRSAAYGIFPDQDSNPCPLHWQADS